MRRLLLALGGLLVLAILAAQTLTDERIRLVTLAILAMFAVKVVIAHRKQTVEAASGASSGTEESLTS